MSADFSKNESADLRKYWVDGFNLSGIRNTNVGIDVQGEIWMMKHQDGRAWKFLMSVPQKMLRKPITTYFYEIIEFDEDAEFIHLNLERKNS